MQINNVMGVTIGPGGYFLNFTEFGLQINKGHEVMMDRCWLVRTITSIACCLGTNRVRAMTCHEVGAVWASDSLRQWVLFGRQAGSGCCLGITLFMRWCYAAAV